MTISSPTPSPREGLDTGSVAELVQDSREMPLEVAAPRTLPVEHHDIVVPDDASSLVDGMSGYGS